MKKREEDLAATLAVALWATEIGLYLLENGDFLPRLWRIMIPKLATKRPRTCVCRLGIAVPMNVQEHSAKSAAYRDGQIVVVMESELEIRFPVAGNPRLAQGTPEQLNRIEITPYGLHWPDLDEDLSFRGLAAGNYGQHQKHPCAGNTSKT